MKLTMYRGDSAVFDLACKQVDGSPLDISTGTLWFTAKSSTRQPDVDAAFQKTTADGGGIAIVNGPLGTATVTIDPEDTMGMYAPAQLAWDLQYVTIGGLAFTLMDGVIMVKADVTNTVALPV
jgi:hypothetical protein